MVEPSSARMHARLVGCWWSRVASSQPSQPDGSVVWGEVIERRAREADELFGDEVKLSAKSQRKVSSEERSSKNESSSAVGSSTGGVGGGEGGGVPFPPGLVTVPSFAGACRGCIGFSACSACRTICAGIAVPGSGRASVMISACAAS